MIADLVDDEGMIQFVYDDVTGLPIRPGSIVKGHPTIGIGRTLDLVGVSEREARLMLSNDILIYVRDLSALKWWTRLDDVRQRAIVNMRHQLGLAGLLGFRGMVAALHRQDWEAAAAAAKASVWATSQTPERAARVIAMIRTGIDPRSLDARGNGQAPHV